MLYIFKSYLRTDSIISYLYNFIMFLIEISSANFQSKYSIYLFMPKFIIQITQIKQQSMFGGSNNFQDQMLKTYVDSVFKKYDADNSGTLDEQQMTVFFNQLFSELKIGKTVSPSQSLEAIKSIDKNFDGNVNKEQLFLAFKMMLAKSQQSVQPPPPPPPTYYGQPMYGGYPQQGGYYNYPPPQGYYGYPQQPGYPQYGNPQMHHSQPQQQMYNQQPYGMNQGYGSPMYGSNQAQNPYQNAYPYQSQNQNQMHYSQNANKNQNGK